MNCSQSYNDMVYRQKKSDAEFSASLFSIIGQSNAVYTSFSLIAFTTASDMELTANLR